MVRLKQIQDKAKRNPVDSQAAKRLVKGSLWTPKDDSKKRSSEETRYVEIVAKKYTAKNYSINTNSTIIGQCMVMVKITCLNADIIVFTKNEISFFFYHFR